MRVSASQLTDFDVGASPFLSGDRTEAYAHLLGIFDQGKEQMFTSEQISIRSGAHQRHFSSLIVLVIDGQSNGSLVLAGALKSIAGDINVIRCAALREAIECLRIHAVDLILLDHQLPALDGIETIRSIRKNHPFEEIPIVMTTIDRNYEIGYRAFEAGANDFLLRPLDFFDCRGRCLNLLNSRRRYLSNKNQFRLQEERIEQVTLELKLLEAETLVRLARAADRRDAITGSHLKRMAKYSALIARGYGLSEDQAETIELAAPMHDIGKIGIPDSILQRRGALDAEQIVVMQTHARIGYDILKDSPSRFLQTASIIALHHHEKFDGTGYPTGLQGEEIPLEARIVTLADVFDALTSARSYKAAWEWDRAVDYVVNEKGIHFDPSLVDVFVSRLDEARQIQSALSDAEHLFDE